MLSLNNIKISRIKNRVNLVFSDGTYLPFFIDDVVKLSLQKNQTIDEEKLTQIIQVSLSYLGNEYALRQVAISPKTEKIISQKLRTFFIRKSQKYKYFSGFNFNSIITFIIDNLNSKNLLNQNDFIKSFIVKNRHKSTKQIKFLLSQKGIDVSSLVLDSNEDINSIKRILNKKRVNREMLANFKLKNKLYSSLFRQGFEISDIKAAIDDLTSLQ